MFNLVRAAAHNADRNPDGLAVVDASDSLSHRQLHARVLAAAAGLRSLGIGRSDVVAVLLPNSSDFLVAALAINTIGGIFLPINTRLSPSEICYIVEHSGARALVSTPQLLQPMERLRQNCPGVRRVVVVGADGSSPLPSGWDTDLDSLIRENGSAPGEIAMVSESDVSRLMYTSGTTARPKGVPLTYGNILWKIFDHVVEFGITRSDRTLVAGPMYHVGAFDLPGIGTWYAGGSLVIADKFEAEQAMRLIERHRVTNVWLAPSMLNAILQTQSPGDHDTSSLRFVTNGGEKMPTALIERFQALFPDTWLADSFGMTETASGDTVLDPASVLTKLGSVGKPLMHVDARVVNNELEDVPVGHTGELILRGPKVFTGYWRDPEATGRDLVDGWLRTGDIAHLDEDGYLFIDDRKKDMIVSGGENIASPEIERVLYRHPDVVEAAVVAMPDDHWGEVPRAVVVTRAGRVLTERELMDWCAQSLARFKVPKRIDFVAELPRTPTGKVLKRELR